MIESATSQKIMGENYDINSETNNGNCVLQKPHNNLQENISSPKNDRNKSGIFSKD